MPWTCPACRTSIRHEGDTPRPQTIYRCHICRLELVLDERSKKLIVAPWPGDEGAPAERSEGS